MRQRRGIEHDRKNFHGFRVIVLGMCLQKVRKHIQNRIEIIDELQTLFDALNIIAQRRLATVKDFLNRILFEPGYKDKIENVPVFTIKKLKNVRKVFDLLRRKFGDTTSPPDVVAAFGVYVS